MPANFTVGPVDCALAQQIESAAAKPAKRLLEQAVIGIGYLVSKLADIRLPLRAHNLLIEGAIFACGGPSFVSRVDYLQNAKIGPPHRQVPNPGG
jgi:hypothetical protein